MAYAGNPTLAAARARLRATMEDLPKAQANIWRPQVTVHGSVNRTHMSSSDKKTAENGMGSITSHQTQSGLEQEFGYEVEVPLFDAQVLGEIDVARADIAGAEAGLTATEQSLLTEVVGAYADVRRARGQVALYRGESDDLLRELAHTEAMVRAASRTIGDLASLRERVAATEADRVRAESALSAAEARFIAVVGRHPGTLEINPTLVGVPAGLEDALMQAEALSPAIARARKEIESASASIDADLGAILPRLSLTHTYTHTRDDVRYAGGGLDYDDLEREEEFAFKLMLTIPIYQGGAVHANVRQAKQTLASAQLTLDAKAREVARDVTAAWVRLDGARETLRLSLRQREAAVEAEQARAYELDNGMSTVDDLLNARFRRMDAEEGLLEAEHQILFQHAALLAAMGRLTARAQDLPVALYDAQADLDRADGRWFGFGE